MRFITVRCLVKVSRIVDTHLSSIVFFQLLLLAYDIGLLRNFSKVILSLSLLSENDFVNISEAVKNF